MKTHNQLIYHCERCGRLAYQEPEDPRPACCGSPMTHAAATTVCADDGFDLADSGHEADEGKSPSPRTPK